MLSSVLAFLLLFWRHLHNSRVSSASLLELFHCQPVVLTLWSYCLHYLFFMSFMQKKKLHGLGHFTRPICILVLLLTHLPQYNPSTHIVFVHLVKNFGHPCLRTCIVTIRWHLTLKTINNWFTVTPQNIICNLGRFVKNVHEKSAFFQKDGVGDCKSHRSFRLFRLAVRGAFHLKFSTMSLSTLS